MLRVKSSFRAGADDAFMQTVPDNHWLADRTVGGSSAAVKVPGASYIVALSVKTGDAPSTSLNSKLKVSDGQVTAYKEYGQPLPAIGDIAAKTRIYFVLKTPTVLLTVNPHFTAFHNASIYFLGSSNTGSVFNSNGDTSPSSLAARSPYVQVISTTSRQW